MEECNNEQVIYIIGHIINEVNHAKLNSNKDTFLNYLEEQKMDGAVLAQMTRKEFGEMSVNVKEIRNERCFDEDI